MEGKAQGYSSAGRASVSKTEGRGFKSCCPCQSRRPTRSWSGTLASGGKSSYLPLHSDIGILPGRSSDRRRALWWRSAKEAVMAKNSPGEFIRQVRAEGSKIVWPTGRETFATAIMVLIMTALLAMFFLGIDGLFRFIVNWLLSLAG